MLCVISMSRSRFGFVNRFPSMNRYSIINNCFLAAQCNARRRRKAHVTCDVIRRLGDAWMGTLQYGACHLNGHLLVRLVITWPQSIMTLPADDDHSRPMDRSDDAGCSHDSVIAGQYLSLLCNCNFNCNPCTAATGRSTGEIY